MIGFRRTNISEKVTEEERRKADKLAATDYAEMINSAKGDEATIIQQTRENIIKYAELNMWSAARYFLDNLKYSEFPLYKVNLAGSNEGALIYTMKQDAGLRNQSIPEFIGNLYSYCYDICSLSDQYFRIHSQELNVEQGISQLTLSDLHEPQSENNKMHSSLMGNIEIDML